MTMPAECPLAGVLANRLRAEREGLVRRWLDRIMARVAIHPNQVFPTDDLLDHVPLLVDGIADYVEDPADEITTDVPVIAKALELGSLRHAQGFGAHQIQKEYEILGGVLFAYLTRVVDEIDQPCTKSEILACSHRLFRAITVIQQVTTDQYLRLSDGRVREREERLRGFNRAVSHELKNRLGAAGGAADMLHEDWIQADPSQIRKFAGIVSRNLKGMREVLQNLIELSRLDSSAVQERNVLLPEVAAEVKRQLREFSESRGVRVDVADLPYVEVPAAAVELALSNYVSNAIKYRNPAEEDPWVRVEGEVRVAGGRHEVLVRVSDNGIGVPPGARDQLFERFFRADPHSEQEGSGLGLSIVRDTIGGIQGRTWAEFPETGSVFAFSIPFPESYVAALGGAGAPST